MKIVITDHRFPNIDQELRAVREAGWELVVGQVSTEDHLIHLCKDADGVLAGRARINKRVIAGMERCRIIVRYGIGVETIDIQAANDRGILVANVPDYCVDEVSDHALTFLLMLSRQIFSAVALAKKERWSLAGMPPLHRLRGQVCGLFGFGRIGSLLARKVSQLGMRVQVHDPYMPECRARECGVESCSFDTLIEDSDFISLHAPLNEETRHRFGASTFERMKATASIINTARGELIDQDALVEALDSGELSGAALDVLELPNAAAPVPAAVVNHPRIIVTPHSAWLSEEARTTLQASAVAQVIATLKGEKPYGLIRSAQIQ
ncbi:MAG: C-terminal binding protein [Candidatus Acidiferrales bacterium]